MVTEREAKCCPFCGEKPEIEVMDFEDDIVTVRVRCKKCGIALRGNKMISKWHSPADYIYAISASEGKAIDAWNRRSDHI